jgi:hypothetical protein
LSEFEQKVMDLLVHMDSKIDQLLNGGTAEGTIDLSEPELIRPSTFSYEKRAEKLTEERSSAEGRRVCPGCGGTSFRTEEDKDKILSMHGGVKIYAKKYICKKCGSQAL